MTDAATLVHNGFRRFRGDPQRLHHLTVSEHGDLSDQGGVLLPASPSEHHAPQAWDAPEATGFVLEGRPLAWSLLDDVELNDTSLVRSGRDLVGATGVVEDIRRGLRIKGPGIVGHEDRRVLVSSPITRPTVDQAIRFCGFGSGNWYHWLTEILPTALLIDRLPDDLQHAPLLVPEAVHRFPAWRESLAVVAPDRAILFAPRLNVTHVQRLVWIDPAVNGPRTLRTDAPLDLHLLLPAVELLRTFRAAVLQRLAVEPVVTPGRRLMLVRPDGTKRSSNQAELLQIARNYGFEGVDPGSLSFREQVRLFANAEAIAGGWGAAWSTMVFAAPETRGLMWSPAPFARWPMFANLAGISGMRLRHVFVEVAQRTMIGANKAPQQVDPEAFESALRAQLAD